MGLSCLWRWRGRTRLACRLISSQTAGCQPLHSFWSSWLLALCWSRNNFLLGLPWSVAFCRRCGRDCAAPKHLAATSPAITWHWGSVCRCKHRNRPSRWSWSSWRPPFLLICWSRFCSRGALPSCLVTLAASHRSRDVHSGLHVRLGFHGVLLS